MPYLWICLTAFGASALTLFSGFGLGTILMPVMAIFFPVPVAVAITAIVHLLNNLFKMALVGRHADPKTVLKFGLPSVVAAFAGAWCLTLFASIPPLFTYSIGHHPAHVEVVKLVIAVLLIAFALLEILPRFQNLSFDSKQMILGGCLSGFFGGLSGNQGALRSAFLIRAGLSKESFIGTTVVIACFVDFTRLFVYAHQGTTLWNGAYINLILAATVSAFLGAWLGARFVKKITIRIIQNLVATLLFVIALSLATGLI